jgi:putative IMPACT (imprinted ancient) family translation regulator
MIKHQQHQEDPLLELSLSNNENNSRSYFNFINSIKSSATHRTYEFIIKKFMQYYNLEDIDELLATKETPTMMRTRS